MQITFQVKWSPKCLFWWILGVLNALKVFCMEVSAVEADSAFTFPSVWVSGAAHLESSQHATGDVFLYVLAESHCSRFFFISRKY